MQAFGYIIGTLPGQNGPDAQEQKADIEAYCKDKGLELFSVIEDVAAESNVPLTSRVQGCLLQVIPDNSHIVFATYGVMCKSHRDWQLQMNAFLAHKHVVHILDWGVSTDAPSWPAVQHIVQTIWQRWFENNTYAVHKASETWKLKLRQLGVKGYWPRNRKPPAGFKTRTTDRRDKDGRKYFLLMKDHAQREQMEKIAQMIDGGMQSEEVAMVLNRANILNVRTGKPWYSASVWTFYRDFKGLEKQDVQLARYLRQE